MRGGAAPLAPGAIGAGSRIKPRALRRFGFDGLAHVCDLLFFQELLGILTTLPDTITLVAQP